MKKEVVMKTTHALVLICFAINISNTFSQVYNLPDVELYTPEGNKINARDISNDSMPMVMVFWKSNLSASHDHLAMLNEVYLEFFESKNVRVVAICVDCIGTIQHVKPFINGHDLKFEFYIDKNGDFKRAMNIPYVPYTLLFDDKMEIYCRQIGYCHGDNVVLCEKIENCLAKMKSEQEFTH